MSDHEQDYAALISRISEGDVGALKEFYSSTSPRMLGYANRFLRNRESAEEVLQEAYLSAWRLAGTYSASISPPVAWLAMIVRSKSLDALRARKRNLGDAFTEFDPEVDDLIDTHAVSPADAAQASEQAVALYACLGRIRLQYRQVLYLSYFHELSHVEIAQHLAVPQGTVKSWVRRALDRLRACMQEFELNGKTL